MQLRTWTPPPGHPLRASVILIFRVRWSGGCAETILPKGNVDILFNLAAAPLVTMDSLDRDVGSGRARNRDVAGLHFRDRLGCGPFSARRDLVVALVHARRCLAVEDDGGSL
jgi:hypothetical protein